MVGSTEGGNGERRQGSKEARQRARKEGMQEGREGGRKRRRKEHFSKRPNACVLCEA
jgi:flagellar biosynthesis/type III secretory pathway protein FliH